MFWATPGRFAIRNEGARRNYLIAPYACFVRRTVRVARDTLYIREDVETREQVKGGNKLLGRRRRVPHDSPG